MKSIDVTLKAHANASFPRHPIVRGMSMVTEALDSRQCARRGTWRILLRQRQKRCELDVPENVFVLCFVAGTMMVNRTAPFVHTVRCLGEVNEPASDGRVSSDFFSPFSATQRRRVVFQFSQSGNSSCFVAPPAGPWKMALGGGGLFSSS